MIDCPNVEMRDQLPDLANDSLVLEARVALLSHVESCEACREELELIRSMRVSMHWSTPKVNAAAIAAAIPAPQPVRLRAAPRRPSPGSWRIAAGITLLALGAGSYPLLRSNPAGVRGDSSVATAVPDSSAGLALTGALADLNETELAALAKDIDKIEALPAADIDTSSPVAVPNGTLPDSVLDQMEGL
jgi:hypothetical protein